MLTPVGRQHAPAWIVIRTLFGSPPGIAVEHLHTPHGVGAPVGEAVNRGEEGKALLAGRRHVGRGFSAEWSRTRSAASGLGAGR